MSQQNNTDNPASGATGSSNDGVKQPQQQTPQDDPIEHTKSNASTNKPEMKNEAELEENKQNDMNVLDMTIKQWLEHLEKISKNGKRKGMKQFRDKLIGENGEFEDDATLRDVAEFKQERVEGWFKDVKGVSGLEQDLIRVLKPHWNKSQANGM